MIEMHEAMDKAIAAIEDIYRNEDISEVEVEEIEFDSENWLVTIGFTRQKTNKYLGGLALPTRTLKVVKIDRHTGAFAGMKIRNPEVERCRRPHPPRSGAICARESW